MRAAVLSGIRQISIKEIADPLIKGADDVLLHVDAVGMCGSDVHYYRSGRIGSQVVEYPFVVGHEFGGTVLATGPDVTRVKAGDLVAVDPNMPCYRCDQCREGRFHTCRDMVFLGCPGQSPWCLCEKIVMPEKSCFPVPASFTAEDAALTEPLSIGCYGVRLSGLADGSRILIQGGGPIGLSVLLAARMRGIREITVSEPLQYRREFALRTGAASAVSPEELESCAMASVPLGFDAVFECCGEQDALDQAQVLIKPGGKLMLIGIPSVPAISFSPDHMRRREICVQNVRRQNECMTEAIRLIEALPEARNMVTHRFGMEETGRAFDTVAGYKEGVIKAMVATV